MVKTITISERVYDMLLLIKKKDESFNELFERMVKEINPKEVLIRLRASMSFRNKKNMLEEVQSKRNGRYTNL